MASASKSTASKLPTEPALPRPTGLPLGVAAARGQRQEQGFTLLEVIAVALIITILAAMAYPDMTRYFANARAAACTANMRAITSGLHAYLADHGAVWPQSPAPPPSEAWDDFWSQSLTDYGIGPSTWQCPEIKAKLSPMADRPSDIPKLHYMPTGFPDIPGIAYRWAKQPWLIEKANAHGRGSLIAFPDGSIKPLFKVLAEQGAR